MQLYIVFNAVGRDGDQATGRIALANRKAPRSYAEIEKLEEVITGRFPEVSSVILTWWQELPG